MTVCTADYWVDCLLFLAVLLTHRLARFPPALCGIGGLKPTAHTDVLSSGLPLSAARLSCSLFVSGLRGLGSGSPAEWRLGEIVLWLSLQPLPWIGCFLRLGRCRLLQPTVILHGSNHGIPILHGKLFCLYVAFIVLLVFFFSRFRTKCVVLFTSINALTIFDCQAQNVAQSVRNDSEWIPRKCTRNFSTECFTFHIKCYNLDSNFHLIHHPLLCRKWCVRALQTGHRLTHTIINEHYLRF